MIFFFYNLSEQGDPLSAFFFFIASEDLNCFLEIAFMELWIQETRGLGPGQFLYADETLTPLALINAEQLRPIFFISLRIHWDQQARHQQCYNHNTLYKHTYPTEWTLQLMGIAMPDNAKHLGLHLGKQLTPSWEQQWHMLNPR